MSHPLISVVLPTYNERDNILSVGEAIVSVFREHNLTGEILIVDDHSPDGTATLAEELSSRFPFVVIRRVPPRSLSGAVLDGFRAAKGEILMVMDADLSHPAEKIPDMVAPILRGECDITVGSRHVPGGAFAGVSFVKRLGSRVAGVLAKGLTSMTDPTSGFMALRRDVLTGLVIDPIGWKIVLEIVVRSGRPFRDIPIVFDDRKAGHSKLSIPVQLEYARHLGRLYRHKFFGR